jgi:hypothetical protein
MSGKKVLSADLAEGDLLTIQYSSKLATIHIKTLTPPIEEEGIAEYIDATIEFISGDNAGKADLYDIIQNKNNKTIQFIHKNRGNFSLPASMNAVDTVTKVATPSNSAAAAAAAASSANSSDSEYDSSGGARRRRRRSTKSKRSTKAKRSTKSKKSKKGKKAKRSRYTRRR